MSKEKKEKLLKELLSQNIDTNCDFSSSLGPVNILYHVHYLECSISASEGSGNSSQPLAGLRCMFWIRDFIRHWG